MIPTVIVEDEKLTIELIQNMLTMLCKEVQIIGTARGVEEAFSVINNKKPKLILLDIQLKDGNGFDLLEKFAAPAFKVIFITAFDQYAVKAFKYSALDYLLKPIDPDGLVQSIQKFQKDQQQQLKLEALKKNRKSLDTLILKTQESYHLVKTKDIIYCQSEGNYTTFYINGGLRVLVSKPIKYFAELLEGQHIYRVHQSYLINLNWVMRYDKSGYVHLKNNAVVPVSARKTAYFLALLKQFGAW